jgi:hypothetical protein
MMRRYLDVLVQRILGGIVYKNMEELIEYVNGRVILIDCIERLLKEWSRYRSVDLLEYKCYVLGRCYMIPDLMMLSWSVLGLEDREYMIGDSFMVRVLDIDYNRMRVTCERVLDGSMK